MFSQRRLEEADKSPRRPKRRRSHTGELPGYRPLSRHGEGEERAAGVARAAASPTDTQPEELEILPLHSDFEAPVAAAGGSLCRKKRKGRFLGKIGDCVREGGKEEGRHGGRWETRRRSG
ncbi:hypothetical protein EYF80_054574 [Liparis tanakae]|uniref:Uncharacterized protein n=1 Tax=Liparis tanakae TaxID=230148 RepID=A0A4Z2F3K1_9TELE|nr:hypothetical protein EYF80_054574 [Liparis tanakae]